MPPFEFGDPGAIPLVGDFDGDDIPGPATYDPSTGRFVARDRFSPGPPDRLFTFDRLPEDDIIVGDFDADGTDAVGVRRGDGLFWIDPFDDLHLDDGLLEFDLFFDETALDALDDPDALGLDDVFFGDWDDGVGAPGLFDTSSGAFLAGRSADTVDGLAGIADMEIFTDGFESGDVSVWSSGGE